MVTHAVYFSEIMYDPQGSDTSREWVEVYNDTTSAVDFTSWKFFESGTNHGITSYSGGSNLQASGYAVIADNPIKFLEDNPSYQGVLYDSSFSLSNSGEQLILKNASGVAIDTVTYSTSLGGNDDGSTLSKIDGSWVRGSATPGNTNQAQATSGSSGTATTTENQATVAQMAPPSADIVLYMSFEKIVVAGVETEFSTYAMTRAGKAIDNLKCNWAFGDGGQAIGTTTTKYRYAYPGRYIVQVEGTNGQVGGVGRMIVHVVPPEIIISKIDSGKYGNYIDITNPSNYSLDLSQWNLSINGNSFQFPKNTLIAEHSTTRFSGLAMGFASTTINTGTIIKISFPNLEEISRFTVGNNTGVVLGDSTSSIPLLPKQTYTIKPQIKVNQVSTTTQINTTTTRNLNVNKDTRIVSWIKSIFRH